MKEFSIFAVAIINLLIGIRYYWMLHKHKIKPALAMWVFFSIAVAMSLLTYMAEGNYSLLDNILNTTDLVLVVGVSIGILIFGDKSTRFTKFDTGCLAFVLIAIIYWIFTQNHLLTNISIQVILVIAYFPVVKRLLETGSNTEPFSVWIGLLLAPMVSLISNEGMLASIYAYRTIACTALLLLLMVRIELINRKKYINIQVL